MNGPDHYREAERLLGTIEARKLGSNETFAAVEMAQVHATLALAAATVEPWVDACSDRTGDYLHRDWVEALS